MALEGVSKRSPAQIVRDIANRKYPHLECVIDFECDKVAFKYGPNSAVFSGPRALQHALDFLGSSNVAEHFSCGA